MADHTKIEWTDATWNIITGCSVVSAGCKHCYAMKLAGTRLQHHPSRAGLTIDTAAGPVWNGQVRFNNEWLDQPLRWCRPRRIFVCAHGDLFHEGVPDEWLDRVFAMMALCPQHTFQVLTKRPARMLAYLTKSEMEIRDAIKYSEFAPAMRWPLPNVHLGVSIEDQPTADERVQQLLQTPAAVRWVSAEPLLGAVDLRPYLDWSFANADMSRPDVDWVVVGGESGTNARPMHPDWVRSLRDQCAAADVAFLFKQWGEFGPGENGHRVPLKKWLEIPNGTAVARRVRLFGDEAIEGHQLMAKVGKRTAGRLLDGIEHNGYPEAS
ncbi:MAG: phage Gp37/Gp68 family protein [Sterolibacterium sp.]|jgi:protein gp37